MLFYSKTSKLPVQYYIQLGYLQPDAIIITGTPLNVGSYTGLIMILDNRWKMQFLHFSSFHTNREKGTVDESLIYAISTRLPNQS